MGYFSRIRVLDLEVPLHEEILALHTLDYAALVHTSLEDSHDCRMHATMNVHDHDCCTHEVQMRR